MNLKNRILSLAAGLMIVASIATLAAYQQLSDNLIERWGKQVAEIQVRYDSARLLQSLEREIGLLDKWRALKPFWHWPEPLTAR